MMPREGSNGIMDVIKARTVLHDPEGSEIGTSRCDEEVTQVATAKALTGSRYEVTVTGSELSLIRTAVDQAERVSRFGIEVLDEAARSRDCKPSEDSRLLREIDALAMREASLRSLQKTMAEVDRGGRPSTASTALPVRTN